MEYSLLYHTIAPFILSALVVVIISIIAERYGTKTGGILGTLPSTIVIAFLFIAVDKGVQFTAQSAIIVPAEMGINLIFLLLFSLLSSKHILIALFGSLLGWAVCTTLLFFSNLTSMILSLGLFLVLFLVIFLFLDKIQKIPSKGTLQVTYTPLKLLGRSLIAGTVIAIAVSVSNIGVILSGIFSVFPAIFLSTMLISRREHGAAFTDAMAKAMIYGSPSVVSYAVGVSLFYPAYGILWGTIGSFLIAVITTLMLLAYRKKIR